MHRIGMAVQKWGIVTMAAAILVATNALPAGAADNKTASGDLAAPENAVLDMRSFCRWSVAYAKPVIPVAALRAAGDASATEPKVLRHDQVDLLAGPLPPADWMAAGFDDSTWPRARLGELAFLPFDQLSSANVCLRGRFAVQDPLAAGNLALSFEYAGGAAVFVNGREVWRGNLPAGALTSETRGTPYPEDAYVDAKGAGIPIDPRRVKSANEEEKKDLALRAGMRMRLSGQIRIPPESLVKGVNVLAISLYRSDFGAAVPKAWFSHSGDGTLQRELWFWKHVNLANLRLQAANGGVAPPTGPASGMRVWVHDIHERVIDGDYGDPNEAIAAIRICGARNGSFCGQVALGSTRALTGIRATVSDLKTATGAGVIPAAEVTILYGMRMTSRGRAGGSSGWYDGLAAQAPAEVPVESGVANLPVFIRVHVPTAAPAGEYAGTLTVSADAGTPVAVPVVLSVADWRMPDPKDYRTYVGIYQSPTSLALHYGMKEWSEEHWRAVEQSFALLGRVGNKLINVPILEHTQFGNDEAMLYFIPKADGSYAYDFTVFDRFVAMAKKHFGSLDHVALHVWHSGGWETRKADNEAMVTVVDPATGKHRGVQVPVGGTEESRKFWKPVLEACRAHLAQAGLEKAMCIGILSDGVAPPEVFRAFDEIWPGGGPALWTRGLHSADRHPAPYRVDKSGALVVLHEYCYGYGLADPDKPLPEIWNQRAMPGTSFRRMGGQDITSLVWYRTFPEQSLFCRTKGIGRLCLDFWPVIASSQRGDTIYNRYPCSSCAQRAPSLFSMTAPGATGAETTVRFELLCQGVQDAEADIVLSDALANHADALGPELAARCRQVLIDRLNYLRSRDQSSYERFMPRSNHAGWRDLDGRAYQCAAEAAKKIGK